jgi:hypothetical protein
MGTDTLFHIATAGVAVAALVVALRTARSVRSEVETLTERVATGTAGAGAAPATERPSAEPPRGAAMDVSIVPRAGLDVTHSRIKVTNWGPHPASSIRMSLDRVDDGLEAPATDVWHRLARTLHPNASDSVQAGLVPGSSSDFWVILEWEDGQGTQYRSIRLTHP